MVRKDWQNLNGLWDYAIRPKDDPKPDKFDGKILVPFAVESALSGVMKRVNDPNRLWYRREFEIPDKWKQNRVLLHFGAVDWDTTVWVNGKQVGTHRGGYDPFSFDITDALKPTGRQEIVLSVWDPTDAGTQARGKQVRNPHKIWYTPTTGVWQTVWLEPVPDDAYITELRMTTDIDASTVTIEPQYKAKLGIEQPGVKVEVSDNGKVIAEGQFPWTEPATLKIDNPKLWSPDSPHLYDVKVQLGPDEVHSYLGMRKIAVAKDKAGVNRLFLNNKPVFQYGAAQEDRMQYDAKARQD
jgi:beta-galactosidase/beta-glucuronidase